MMFNLKPKIVKFKNGKYGIRKYSLFYGWLFQISFSGRWANKNVNLAQEYDSLEMAGRALSDIIGRQERESDMGVL